MKKFFKYNRGAAIGALVLLIVLSVFLGINRTVSSYKNNVINAFSKTDNSVSADLQKYGDYANQLYAIASANGCSVDQLKNSLTKLDASDPFGGADQAVKNISSAAAVVYAELSAKTNVDDQQMRSATSYYYEMDSTVSRIKNNTDYNNKAKKYNKAANAFPATMIVVFTDTTDDAAVFE